MQCRYLASQLGRLYADFQAAGSEVLLILGEPIDQARSYAEILHLPFPVLSDPDRAVYHHFGLGKRLFLQQTATVIVDRAGVIRYLKRVTNPMVWLQESAGLLSAARQIGGG